MPELTTLLRELAAQLGTTVDHLWEVLQVQARLWVVRYALWATSGLVIGAAGAWLSRRLLTAASTWNGSDREGGVALAWVLRVGSLGGGAAILLHNVYWILTCWLNPEFAALSWVLERLR